MPENKKEIVVAFLQLASSGDVNEAYHRYVHPNFHHHNPYFQGDRASLLAGMEEGKRQFPNKTFQPVHVFADGEYVIVHGKVRLRPDLPEIALVHIFRFEDGLIIEEWEASQEWPKESLNENGMF